MGARPLTGARQRPQRMRDRAPSRARGDVRASGGQEGGRWAAGPLGRWAAGPLGRWAAGPLGRWAAGPLGRWAAGPLGRWAAGPLGRWAAGPLGRWAAGPLGRWAAGPNRLRAVPAKSSAFRGLKSHRQAVPQHRSAETVSGRKTGPQHQRMAFRGVGGTFSNWQSGGRRRPAAAAQTRFRRASGRVRREAGPLRQQEPARAAARHGTAVRTGSETGIPGRGSATLTLIVAPSPGL